MFVNYDSLHWCLRMFKGPGAPKEPSNIDLKLVVHMLLYHKTIWFDRKVTFYGMPGLKFFDLKFKMSWISEQYFSKLFFSHPTYFKMKQIYLNVTRDHLRARKSFWFYSISGFHPKCYELLQCVKQGICPVRNENSKSFMPFYYEYKSLTQIQQIIILEDYYDKLGQRESK